MIPLLSRSRLKKRRNALYAHLIEIAKCASVHQVEDIMRRIHILNFRIQQYDQCPQQEPKQVFSDEEG
jgi:hypothetical protein